MTLHSRVIIANPTAVRPVFDEMRRLLGATEQYHWRHRTSVEHDFQAGTKAYSMDLGQGLPALMWIDYGADGPLPNGPGTDVTNDPGDPRLDSKDYDNWCCYQPFGFIEVNVDTTYGYRATNGAGCSDLHAWLIDSLGSWLDARNLDWHWHDEYRGDWHHRDLDGFLCEFGNIRRGAVSGIRAVAS